MGLPSEDTGTEWLKAKGREDGVVTLPSGLMYKVLKSGPKEGKSPKANTPCNCHYEGTLINGTVFDSSYKRGEPTTFAPNQVIPGWTEAMQLMKEGDKWELYCPPNLAYGRYSPSPKIPANSTLIFQMEIISMDEAGSGGMMWFAIIGLVAAALYMYRS